MKDNFSAELNYLQIESMVIKSLGVKDTTRSISDEITILELGNVA